MKTTKLTNILLGRIAFNLSVLTLIQVIPKAHAQRTKDISEVKIVGIDLNHKVVKDSQKLPVSLEGYEGLYLEYLRTGHPIPVKILDQ